VISGAAFCPHPPVLVPALAGAASVELAALRAACRESVIRIASVSDRLVLLGGGDRAASYPASAVGSFAGVGADLRVSLGGELGAGPAPEAQTELKRPVELPLALAVGAELVEDAIGDALPRTAVSVSADAVEAAQQLLVELTADGRVGLVVLGDGSARRTAAAPGYLDERAVAFDDHLAEALRTGDAYVLEDLDQTLADELLVAGAPAWRTTGRMLRNRRFDADLRAYEAPFGVGYFVATWIPRG
jgi:uncharacterized protein YaiI (UPF0178 family)